MIKEIKIHLKQESDYKNNYNDKILSYELCEFINEEVKNININDKLTFVISTNFNINDDEKNNLVNMIRNCFGTDVGETINFSKKQTIANCLILLIGILFLVLYYVIIPKFISDLTLILGWVFIGEAICNLLYHGVENKLNIKRKKQITDAKITFK